MIQASYAIVPDFFNSLLVRSVMWRRYFTIRRTISLVSRYFNSLLVPIRPVAESEEIVV